jgi:hypothetical protein
MGISLAIENHKVRKVLQLLPCLVQKGELTKRE